MQSSFIFKRIFLIAGYRFEGTAFVISNVSDDDKGTYTYVAEPKEYSPFITVMRKNINFDVWSKYWFIEMSSILHLTKRQFSP